MLKQGIQCASLRLEGLYLCLKLFHKGNPSPEQELEVLCASLGAESSLAAALICALLVVAKSRRQPFPWNLKILF